LRPRGTRGNACTFHQSFEQRRCLRLDYKAAFLNTLGANAEFYGKFADNARAWHKRAQEAVLYLNHALVNPPIDRNKPVEQVKDVYITVQKETDAGIYVSGAKVVATNSALTHYNFLGQNMGQEITDPSMVVMFIAPMNTPGVKLICRPSYEFAAAATGSPWDYPLTSRFDENDAIFVFDNAFVPWENVIIHRDIERLKNFYPRTALEVCGERGQGRKTRLFAEASAFHSMVSSAIFCASMTSPTASSPCGAKHH
jgi:4-hydroxyphenylacetate 3-monooxygenase